MPIFANVEGNLSHAIAASAYVLLQMEQTALVIGSVLLFVVLAGIMVLTRRVDWYRLLNPAATPQSAA